MIDATPLLKIYTRRRLKRLAVQHPADTQQRQLLKLVGKAARTRFGRDHDFANITSVKDYQERVRLRNFQDMWDEYWGRQFPTLSDCSWPGRMPYFALTSGTTKDENKFIPCSNELMLSNRRGALDLLTHHLANRPNSRVFGGKTFMLGGSTALVHEAPGVLSGELSGIAAKTVPFWARSRFFPPLELAHISDWEEKISRFAEASIGADIRGFGGTPSWMLIFLDRLAELGGGGRRQSLGFYPNLELIVHGGVNFAPYRRQFEELCQGTRAELREIYVASEAFIAVADRGADEGMRLLLDSGIFYEFVPLDELDSETPTRHWVGDAEIGVNYALVLSNCAGAWSYVIGDTVRLVDRDPPRLLVSGRTAYSLSAFGEHLIGEEIENSIAAAADSIDATISDYSVGAIFPEREGELGGHLYVIEFLQSDIAKARLDSFAAALDHRLCDGNADYRAHRSDGFGLDLPRIRAVRSGTFAGWMKRRGKLGGQNKVPRIINDQALFGDLREFSEDYSPP
ncbi:MAG: GH3 auxin-responsive promoter family protein [Alphaproteobacteria bacterium]|nr:GH3 auxin-responsive promoter family protein [Alphaproteobacteria bacterium]